MAVTSAWRLAYRWTKQREDALEMESSHWAVPLTPHMGIELDP